MGRVRLIADIGGTNARFAMVSQGGELSAQVRLAVGGQADFASALEAALARLGNPLPDEAMVAVAGPVHNGVCRLTNADWIIDAQVIAGRLDSPAVQVVNDFQAVALALPHLGPDDCLALDNPVQEPVSDPALMKLALGPGTGLGVALHLGGADGTSVATEGGHVPLALADTALRERLQANLRIGLQAGIQAISQVNPHDPQADDTLEAEHVLSGPGLARLHQALHGAALGERQITAAADAGDQAAGQTIATFLDLLARFAANTALSTGALGGVYIAGGLIGEGHIRVDATRFRQTFNGRGRMAGWLARVPLYIITRPDPAFLGLARASLS